MSHTAEDASPEGAREGTAREGAGHEGDVPRRRTGSARMTERLLRSADEEFLRHGYEAARVSRIARRADVTSGAVYARWPSKTELLVDALDRTLQQIVTERGFGQHSDGQHRDGRGDGQHSDRQHSDRQHSDGQGDGQHRDRQHSDRQGSDGQHSDGQHSDRQGDGQHSDRQHSDGRGDGQHSDGQGDGQHSDGRPSPSELTAMLGLDLPSVDAPRDVLVHVFGAAHNNEEIGTLVQGFVNQLAQQRLRLVESAQSAGHCDPDIGTAAGSLFCEAAGIGLRLLLAAGLDGRLVPSTEEWNTLVARLFGAQVPADGDRLPT